MKEGDMSRKDFLRSISLATGAVLLNTEALAKVLSREDQEKPTIISRAQWDDLWTQINSQYDKTLGDTFKITINGVELTKTVDVLPYLSYEKGRAEPSNLKDAYRRLVVHHSAMVPSGTYVDQARAVRDLEVGSMGFNDVGYHFMILSDGSILEGRPINRVGSHAGKTQNSGKYLSKYLPGGIKDIFYSKGTAKYFENLKVYDRAMQMDPDYGSLGVLLHGDFENGGEPNQAQIDSFVKLLNWINPELDIPLSNIIYHHDVKKEVVEDSGLDGGTDTVCPGKSFLPFHKIKNRVTSIDSPNALSKPMTLNKYM